MRKDSNLLPAKIDSTTMKTTVISLQTKHVGNDNNQPQMMTSLEIAELTGKQHKNVMQAIRNMESSWEKIAGLKFQLGSYKEVDVKVS